MEWYLKALVIIWIYGVIVGTIGNPPYDEEVQIKDLNNKTIAVIQYEKGFEIVK